MTIDLERIAAAMVAAARRAAALPYPVTFSVQDGPSACMLVTRAKCGEKGVESGILLSRILQAPDDELGGIMNMVEANLRPADIADGASHTGDANAPGPVADPRPGVSGD